MSGPIDHIGTLRRLAAAITASGAEITTIAADVANIDGDAMRGTDDAALAVNWTAALATALANYTAVRAGYIDELDFNLQASLINQDSNIADLLYDTSILEHKWESRTRVYPQSTLVAPQVTSSVVADTFGSWVEIIPINTVNMDYRVLGVEIEETNRAGVFLLQFGYSATDGDDPTTAQIVGERRVHMIGTPIKLEQASKEIYGGHIPANSKLWARLKSDNASVDILDISLIVTRCLQVVNPIGKLATWPWAS